MERKKEKVRGSGERGQRLKKREERGIRWGGKGKGQSDKGVEHPLIRGTISNRGISQKKTRGGGKKKKYLDGEGKEKQIQNTNKSNPKRAIFP